MDIGTKTERLNVSQSDIKPLGAVIESKSKSFNRLLCEKTQKKSSRWNEKKVCVIYCVCVPDGTAQLLNSSE